MKKWLIILAIILIILVGVMVGVFKMFYSKVGPVTLTYSSLWEDPTSMESVIADYQRLHPNVTIKFLKQNQIDYKDRIVASLQGANPPDIVRIHSTWIPLIAKLVAPVPTTTYTPSEFQATFYPTAVNDLVFGGKIMAIPLEIDGLVLYVNTDLLDKAGMTPATSWEEFQDQVQRLTVRDESGKIKTAGAALGTTSNVDHWQDIVSLMFLQNNAKIEDPTGEAGEGALSFYSDYSKKLGVWDDTQDGSTLAFSRGKVVYYFGPTWRYFDILEFSKDTPIHFKMISVPQISGDQPITQASYWAEAVALASSHKTEAFDFLKYLSSKEVLLKLYSEEAKLREFGEPYSRQDMKELLVDDPHVGPFLKNADVANSTWLSSFTWDGKTGINGVVSDYYENALNSISQSGDPTQATETIKSGMQQLYSRLGVVANP